MSLLSLFKKKSTALVKTKFQQLDDYEMYKKHIKDNYHAIIPSYGNNWCKIGYKLYFYDEGKLNQYNKYELTYEKGDGFESSYISQGNTNIHELGKADLKILKEHSDRKIDISEIEVGDVLALRSNHFFRVNSLEKTKYHYVINDTVKYKDYGKCDFSGYNWYNLRDISRIIKSHDVTPEIENKLFKYVDMSKLKEGDSIVDFTYGFEKTVNYIEFYKDDNDEDKCKIDFGDTYYLDGRERKDLLMTCGGIVEIIKK